jgi:hypothetical protein
MNNLKSSNLRTVEFNHAFHVRLAEFNVQRLSPQIVGPGWIDDVKTEAELRIAEGQFIEAERSRVRHLATTAPRHADGFISWFEALRAHGPGQNDALFPWLETEATLAQMRWFLTQEAAGEAGFEDLVAMTQVKLPVRAKLEMARNYWDEMGRGHERGMHGPMLAMVVNELRLNPSVKDTCWESLALANLMVGLAANRRYTYHAIGALGAIEMTAPARVSRVNKGLRRLAASTSARKYYQLHAGLDIQHSQAWNTEVIYSIVAENPRTAASIAEGALLRLASGARCFARYRAHFDLEATYTHSALAA